MSTMTLTCNGSMIIPEAIVRSAHICDGDQVSVRVNGESIVLERQHEGAMKAKVVMGRHGRKVLRAPMGSPPMTVESVKQQLDDLDLS